MKTMPSKQPPGKTLPTGKQAFPASSNPSGQRAPHNEKASGNRPAGAPPPSGSKVPDWKR